MRIDWAYEPVGLEAREGLPPFIGPFPAAADPLIQFGHRWAASAWFPSVSRVAVGFTLLSPTRDRETGYQELSQFIDGVPNTPDARDFYYQVNRPRVSRAGIEGLQVNRLAKWSVGAFLVFAVAFDGTSNPSSATQRRAIICICFWILIRVQITRGGIPRGNIEGLIDDLFAAGQEISEHGNRL